MLPRDFKSVARSETDMLAVEWIWKGRKERGRDGREMCDRSTINQHEKFCTQISSEFAKDFHVAATPINAKPHAGPYFGTLGVFYSLTIIIRLCIEQLQGTIGMSSAFVSTSQQRHLRACMVCSIVQTHSVRSSSFCHIAGSLHED